MKAKIWLVLAHYRKDVPPNRYYIKHYTAKGAKEFLLDIAPYMKIYEVEEWVDTIPWDQPFNFWLDDTE